MSEEEINAIFDSIPKVENNNCVSAYGSVNIEDIKNAMKRLNKVPDYNDLLVENKELKQRIDKAIEYIKENDYRFDGDDMQIGLLGDEINKLLEILEGDK